MLWHANGTVRAGFGRAVFAAGDDPMACRLTGVRVWQVLLMVYVLCAFRSAVARILPAGRTGSVGLQRPVTFLDAGRDMKQSLYGRSVPALAWLYARAAAET